MQPTNDVWSWSESFTEMLEVFMRKPPADRANRLDWHGQQERLGWWRAQFDTARELYRKGQTEALRMLYECWRTIADDIQEQVSIACETYRQFISGRALRPPCMVHTDGQRRKPSVPPEAQGGHLQKI
jgi:hypothetical protein